MNKIFCPKETILNNLLNAPFWGHLSDGAAWKEDIQQAIKATSDYQLEQDNFRLQGDINVAMSVIAEQEVKLKIQTTLINEYKDAIRKVRVIGDELQQLRVQHDYF